MAVHGNGDWIIGYHDRQFFLNRQLIKDRGLDLQDFRREVADFLGRMAGISNVVTIDDIIASRAGDNPAALKRNTSLPHAGDVMIEVSPGWQIVDDGTGRASGVQRHTAVDAPAYIIMPGLKRSQITTMTDARQLAPTLCRLLMLRAPNGASLPHSTFESKLITALTNHRNHENIPPLPHRISRVSTHAYGSDHHRPTEHHLHYVRRHGLRRSRLLRTEADCNAANRFHGRQGYAIHPGLCR